MRVNYRPTILLPLFKMKHDCRDAMTLVLHNKDAILIIVRVFNLIFALNKLPALLLNDGIL